jgi:type II secretory pathway component HofQ
MAQHFWLMQRAITLQDKLLTTAELDHKTFSLYLRYQTTNERAYYRAKREFETGRKEQAKQQNGFESQKRQQEAHEAKIRLTNARAQAAEIENEVKSTMEAPLPGHIRIPFEDLTAAFRLTLQNLNKEFTTELKKQTAA